ncbi:hypothetical protein BC936DRAFT_140298 [Jimgerdemannia flammicorona]|uniref:Epoxide hydrolase N-terminal domain-containing protein n=1 Tax=Jimgerdemannia flammicorona TaxID=994334 RepID=A0A433AVH8_9FUNG|nr:hypothetical protein BC936DRAFT_140298 [Jimgerdemannia flammicorona]
MPARFKSSQTDRQDENFHRDSKQHGLPFTVSLDPSIISHPRTRLSNPIYPAQLTPASWDQGTELSALQQMVAYWRDEFDWRPLMSSITSKCARMGLTPILSLSGPPTKILCHFYSSMGDSEAFGSLTRSSGSWSTPDAENPNVQVGLVCRRLCHDIVPSFFEAFHVVVPSLPGYGFSISPRISLDEFLSIVTIYYGTGTIVSSYYEYQRLCPATRWSCAILGRVIKDVRKGLEDRYR